MASKDSTSGTTRSNGEAAWAMSGVGGVRSSDDPVPDLWSGKPAGERRDTTCSAMRKRNEELVTALWAISAMKVQELQPHAGIVAFGYDERNSESRMRENRPSGLMRGGKQTVIGLRVFQSTAPRLLYVRPLHGRTNSKRLNTGRGVDREVTLAAMLIGRTDPFRLRALSHVFGSRPAASQDESYDRISMDSLVKRLLGPLVYDLVMNLPKGLLVFLLLAACSYPIRAEETAGATEGAVDSSSPDGKFAFLAT